SRFPACGDVLKDGDGVEQLAIAIVERRGRDLECDAFAVTVDLHVVDCRVLAAQRADDRHAVRRIGLVGPGDVRRITLAEVAGTVAFHDAAPQHRLRHRVRVNGIAVRVENEDAHRQCVNELRQSQAIEIRGHEVWSYRTPGFRQQRVGQAEGLSYAVASAFGSYVQV